jgi:hypothetical protein
MKESSSFADNLLLGTVIGVLLPLLVFMLYYLSRFDDVGFVEYLSWLSENQKIVHVLSLSVSPNIISFMVFVKKNKLRSGRGVLLATILFGILVFVLKWSVN